MKKCVICGRNTPKWDHIINCHQNVVRLLENDVDQHGEWVNCDDSTIIHDNVAIPVVCELDWTALMWNGWEHIWDGTNLMVSINNGTGWVEASGNVFKPSKPTSIQFEYDENTQEWMVQPR